VGRLGSNFRSDVINNKETSLTTKEKVLVDHKKEGQEGAKARKKKNPTKAPWPHPRRARNKTRICKKLCGEKKKKEDLAKKRCIFQKKDRVPRKPTGKPSANKRRQGVLEPGLGGGPPAKGGGKENLKEVMKMKGGENCSRRKRDEGAIS